MSARTFLDTNVIVYAFDKSNPKKSQVAQSLIEEGRADKRSIISYQVVQEFINVVSRGFRIAITPRDLDHFLFTALFPMAAVSWSPALTMQALRIREAYLLGWYDSLIVAAALQGECKALLSEDLQHGQRFSELVVENPFR
jgi:predicted nucleic acid-binding protein